MHSYKESFKRWSKQEDNYIRENYSGMVVSDIAKQLERSPKGTRNRIERLGLRLSALPRNIPKPRIKRRKYLGWHYASYGRKYISVSGRGSVAEHRYLVEQKLGRKLKRIEQVHHINGDKKDNRIENLHLFPDVSSHLTCQRSIEKILKPLMERGIIKFNSNTGRYET